MRIIGKQSIATFAWAFAFICAVICMLACIPPSTALASTSDKPKDIPLVMVVIGFDGGDDPGAAVPYDSEYDWSAALFGEPESPAAYYRAMSEGAFTFSPVAETSATGVADNTNVADRENDGVIHVTLHRPHGAWGAVNVDANVTRDFCAVLMEGMRAATQYIDFTKYDTNKNDTLDNQELAVCVCVAGYEASSVSDYYRTDMPLLWAHSGYLGLIDENLRIIDDVRFESYIAIAEHYWDEGSPLESAVQEPLGVVYHELGHALGLPDLYAVRITEGPWSDFKVGPFSLMDSGGWQYGDDGAGWRNIPTALDSWSRYALDWTNPTVVCHSGDYTVSSQFSDNGYMALIIPTNDPNQYFLVENRQPEGQDVSLGGAIDNGGLVVWHVDNTIYDEYYYANQMNDANHRPGVMQGLPPAEQPTELLLYNPANDNPDACVGTGITIQFDGNPSHDITVHVELDDEAAAKNVVNLLDDKARDFLGMLKKKPLDKVIDLVAATARQ